MPFGSLQCTVFGSCACVWAKLYVPFVLGSVRVVLVFHSVTIEPFGAAASRCSTAAQQLPIFSQGEGRWRGRYSMCQHDGGR